MRPMILPIEQQITSFEISKFMKELGFPQDSLFFWAHKDEGEPHLITHDSQYRSFYENTIYSAYTVAELGIILKNSGTRSYMQYHPDGYMWGCEQPGTAKNFIADTEANARGRMAIRLKEDNDL